MHLGGTKFLIFHRHRREIPPLPANPGIPQLEQVKKKLSVIRINLEITFITN